MSDLTFRVEGVSNSPAQFIAKARNFSLVIDEPQDLGGTDEGANPVEYILAGLAGCLNVVGHLVAKELDFEILKLEIKVSGTLNPNKLLGSSIKERAGFKEIFLDLIPTTDASLEILTKWLTIVEERCPVRDNLINETPVRLGFTKPYVSR